MIKNYNLLAFLESAVRITSMTLRKVMSITYSKILVIILLFLGESLCIYAEVVGAKNAGSSSFLLIFLKMFLIITLAGGLLVASYMLGFNAFKNIWIVSAVSIASILIMEPTLNWIIIKQLPTPGAIIGFVLGVIGLFVSLRF